MLNHRVSQEPQKIKDCKIKVDGSRRNWILEQFSELVKELKERTAECGGCERGMTSQQVWQAACVYFGDTALVDDALKLLNNSIVGDDNSLCCESADA